MRLLRQIEVNFIRFFHLKSLIIKEAVIISPKEHKISEEFKIEENKDGSENPKPQKNSIENTLLTKIVDDVSISGNPLPPDDFKRRKNNNR